MARLGERIDTEVIILGARSVAEVLLLRVFEDERDGSPPQELIKPLLADLGYFALKYIPEQVPVAVFGNLFLASEDPLKGNYDVPIEGVSAGLVGVIRGIGMVTLPRAAVLESGAETTRVPALSFVTRVVELEDGPGLGLAQLYERVAVPLLDGPVEVWHVARANIPE